MSTHKPHINSTPIPLLNGLRETLHVNGHHGHPRRSATPIGRPIPANTVHLMNSIEGDLGAEEHPRLAVFRSLYVTSEARVNRLFEEKDRGGSDIPESADGREGQHDDETVEETPGQGASSTKKPTRTIDEDDYDESDDDEDDDDSSNFSPLKSKSTVPPNNLALSSVAMVRDLSSNSTPASVKAGPSSVAGKTTEEARKKLEDDKKATEDAAKRSFNTLFYTLENDRGSMLEQKKLEEAERQVDVEMGGHGTSGNNANGLAGGNAQQGTLSQSNLGASSLTLKNLIRQIDAKRDQVQATDTELRTLMSEVRKNRSKWASEDKIGQEELYEAAEKVLNELRAMTEHSGPFLTRVNKKEAPDYYSSKFGRVSIWKQNPTNLYDSHQDANGSWLYDEEAEAGPVQIQDRVCQRSQAHLAKLFTV